MQHNTAQAKKAPCVFWK